MFMNNLRNGVITINLPMLFLNFYISRKYPYNYTFCSLNRTFELRSYALRLEKSQINLAFCSLNRTFATYFI